MVDVNCFSLVVTCSITQLDHLVNVIHVLWNLPLKLWTLFRVDKLAPMLEGFEPLFMCLILSLYIICHSFFFLFSSVVVSVLGYDKGLWELLSLVCLPLFLMKQSANVLQLINASEQIANLDSRRALELEIRN